MYCLYSILHVFAAARDNNRHVGGVCGACLVGRLTGRTGTIVPVITQPFTTAVVSSLCAPNGGGEVLAKGENAANIYHPIKPNQIKPRQGQPLCPTAVCVRSLTSLLLACRAVFGPFGSLTPRASLLSSPLLRLRLCLHLCFFFSALHGAVLAHKRGRPVLAKPVRVPQAGAHPQSVEGGVSNGGGGAGGRVAFAAESGADGEG